MPTEEQKTIELFLSFIINVFRHNGNPYSDCTVHMFSLSLLLFFFGDYLRDDWIFYFLEISWMIVNKNTQKIFF